MAKPKRKRSTRKTTANKKTKEEECSSTSVEEQNVDPTMGASSTVEKKEELPEDPPTLDTNGENIGEDNAVIADTNGEVCLPTEEHTDLADNIIPNEEILDPENPSEEFVFAPIISASEHLEVDTVNLITPSSSRHSSSNAGAENNISSKCATAEKTKTKDSDASNSCGECSHNLLIEVIDVDDLPDTPTPLSSIGDDVIEITPDNSVRGESPELVLDRQVVDLTGNGDAESSTYRRYHGDDDLSDIEEDALLSIWSRMSKRRKSNSASSADNKQAESVDKPDEPEKPESQSKNKLNCPICMDDFSMIVKDRQLMSTSCGHVFCNVCIRAAIETQKKCPTCRKKQLLKNLHPIFL